MSTELDARTRAEVVALISRSDFTRGRALGADAYKEWQHFIVHAEGVHALINFNLSDDPWHGQRVARVVVMAHAPGQGWTGAVERLDSANVNAPAASLRLDWGRQRVDFESGTYLVEVELESGRFAASLRLTPDAQPMMSTNRELAGDRRLSWFFLPRLRASGRLVIEDRTIELDGALAYHDHNWGNFRWGDDFCWEWASILGQPDDPWTLVFMRVLDRRRTRIRSAGLYLFRNGLQHRYFLDDDVEVEHYGLRPHTRPSLCLPRVMGLLAPTAGGVPREIVVRAGEGPDSLELRLETGAGARVVTPNDTDLDGVTVLHEIAARARLDGRVRGQRVRLEGQAVLELIRGTGLAPAPGPAPKA